MNATTTISTENASAKLAFQLYVAVGIAVFLLMMLVGAVFRAAQAEWLPVPVNYGVYTFLPAEITEETKQLARRITSGLTTNYDKAIAIERWLETNLQYTLELKDPGKTEPVHFFLFDRKKGHCEYFASAFAVLARA